MDHSEVKQQFDPYEDQRRKEYVDIEVSPPVEVDTLYSSNGVGKDAHGVCVMCGLLDESSRDDYIFNTSATAADRVDIFINDKEAFPSCKITYFTSYKESGKIKVSVGKIENRRSRYIIVKDFDPKRKRNAV